MRVCWAVTGSPTTQVIVPESAQVVMAGDSSATAAMATTVEAAAMQVGTEESPVMVATPSVRAPALFAAVVTVGAPDDSATAATAATEQSDTAAEPADGVA